VLEIRPGEDDGDMDDEHVLFDFTANVMKGYRAMSKLESKVEDAFSDVLES